MLASGGARAAPHVVPGIGEPEAARLYPQMPAPSRVAAAPAPAPAPGAYGGGFIELLVTGYDPTPNGAPSPRPLPRQRVAAYAPSGAIDLQRQVDPMFLRTEVDYPGHEQPGTVVIDTPHKFLYFVVGGGRAVRYGVGVGRPGFEWSGVKTVSRKSQWPDWTPPPEMLMRRPDLPRHMDGGPANPLGARALYLGSSLYRIHGTNEPYTIGQNVSSGCIRMMNDDVADLYDRVHVGTRVVVL
ncbi:MAG: L,D-transpeptidase [Methylocystis sp.]|nr:L,D-transpeptidase [Methylocystis sp.]